MAPSRPRNFTLNGFHENYQRKESREEESPLGSLASSFTLEHNGRTYEVNENCLFNLERVGSGAYGSVERVMHNDSRLIMARKRIRIGDSSKEQKKQLIEIEVYVRTSPRNCENIPHFYGAFFWENQLHIFMELMDCSLDTFNNKVYSQNKGDHRFTPEYVLIKIAGSLLEALDHLYQVKIMHRDIKPSNVLINRLGEVKLCDFGISADLSEYSRAKTFDAGCRP